MPRPLYLTHPVPATPEGTPRRRSSLALRAGMKQLSRGSGVESVDFWVEQLLRRPFWTTRAGAKLSLLRKPLVAPPYMSKRTLRPRVIGALPPLFRRTLTRFDVHRLRELIAPMDSSTETPLPS